MKKVIVFGSFDPLHEGHKDLFRQAKGLGDFLVVVVARDENIRRMKRRDPRVGEKERMAVVVKEGVADKVILGNVGNDYSVIDLEKPDVIAVGYDQKIPEILKDKVKKYKIVRLKAYKPEIFKSSRIRKDS